MYSCRGLWFKLIFCAFNLFYLTSYLFIYYVTKPFLIPVKFLLSQSINYISIKCEKFDKVTDHSQTINVTGRPYLSEISGA